MSCKGETPLTLLHEAYILYSRWPGHRQDILFRRGSTAGIFPVHGSCGPIRSALLHRLCLNHVEVHLHSTSGIRTPSQAQRQSWHQNPLCRPSASHGGAMYSRQLSACGNWQHTPACRWDWGRNITSHHCSASSELTRQRPLQRVRRKSEMKPSAGPPRLRELG